MFAYKEVVNHFLASYATDDVTADTFSYICLLTQGPSIPTTVCSDAVWTKVLRGGQVYDEAQLKELFVENLQPSIRLSMRPYWVTNKKTSMQALAQHSDSLRRPPVGMTYAEDVERQIQPHGRSRGKTRPILTVQSGTTASTRKSSESSRGKKAGQAFAAGSHTGS